MAALVQQQVFDVRVSHHAFCFQDSDESLVPVEYPDEYEWGRFLNVRHGRIDFFSGGHTHIATVCVEVWDGEPPCDGRAEWDEQSEATMETACGELAVWEIGRSEHTVVLSDGAGRWWVRVYCAGRDEAKRRSTEEGPVQGVERYLVQFWPGIC
ncbi:hypothetical protein ABT174_36355 [Streptomyces sparsogenes]|uniref:hypothetical protein n=1 Tax=Streptomyces sparsogenes TaxID=67365 RepID=UPI00331FA262